MKPGNLTVLVTAIGGVGYGDQILKALRLVEPSNYRLIGTDLNPLTPQQAQVDHFEILSAAGDPDYLQSVLDLCKREQIDVIFPGCDSELIVFSNNRQTFSDLEIYIPIQSSHLIDTCLDKVATFNYLETLGITVPASFSFETGSEICPISIFPIVLKPSVGTGGSNGVYIAQDYEELQMFIKMLEVQTQHTQYLLQEYVGTPENEYTVGVLHNSNGQYINSIALRRHLDSSLGVRLDVKNRTIRSDLGPRLVVSTGISQGTIGRFDSITSQCVQIAESLESKGPLNFQCRVVEDQVIVFEINPRLSGTTSIRAMVGFNEPDIMIRNECRGELIESDFEYVEGQVIRTIQEHLVAGKI